MSLFVGYEVGTAKPIVVPVFFMLVTGQTQLSGKTTLLKALASQVVDEGFTVLIIDSKTNYNDYENFGVSVQVCLRESTDPLILLGLLESIFERKMTKEYATLITCCEGAQSLEDIYRNAETLAADSNPGFQQNACKMIMDILARLQEQTRMFKTVPELTLNEGKINRMSINDFMISGQQMIVKTVFEDALPKYKKLILILDEASRFLPQKWGSACQKAVQAYVTQGGITKQFMWIGTQFLATTSKDAMKTMDVKLLGRQSHNTECEHTLALIPYGKGTFTNDSIMRLKVGHFIVVNPNSVTTAYACPEYADPEECQEVALGSRDPKDVTYLIELPEGAEKPAEPMDPSSTTSSENPEMSTEPPIPESVATEERVIIKQPPPPWILQTSAMTPNKMASEIRSLKKKHRKLCYRVKNLETLAGVVPKPDETDKEEDEPETKKELKEMKNSGQTVPV